MVNSALLEMLRRNKQYAQNHQTPENMNQMATNMNAGVVVVLCSDPRLNPQAILGLDSSLKATLVRNAGGRVAEVIKTLLVLQALSKPDTIVIMHHTDCGMSHFRNSQIADILIQSAPEEKDQINSYDFGEIVNGPEDSVRQDMRTLKSSLILKADTHIIGLVYDMETGLLKEILEEHDQP